MRISAAPGFEWVDLSGAKFRSVDLAKARFRGVDLSGVVMRGVELVDVDEIDNVTINGVDVAPLVNAELDRRYTDRAKMRPTDPGGFREAWDVVERLWGETVERARRLDPEPLLHQSVGGEWSFIETLRGISCSRRTPGSDGRFSVIRHRGTHWTCRGTRCLTRRACQVTATYDRRSTQSSCCAATGCPRSARSSAA